MQYLAVLGRQSELSVAELAAQFSDVQKIGGNLALFEAPESGKAGAPDLNRLGGTVKLAVKLEETPAEFLLKQDRKVVLGVSDYSKKRASGRNSQGLALKFKRILRREGKSARVLPNNDGAALSSATVFHHQLGEKAGHFELILVDGTWYRGIAVQNINSYRDRDQERPARDAKVGMLPPKLAQILVNLCGKLPENARILDPFCGTGVVLQEAMLLGYQGYGTDKSEKMVEYSKRNLEWLVKKDLTKHKKFDIMDGDATSYQWKGLVSAVAAETYLGPPMSEAPAEMKLREVMQECKGIITGFLANIAPQIEVGTPLALAIPAWLRPDGTYKRLNLLDDFERLGYNVKKFGLYQREGQVVAREIIVLRKK